MPAAAPAPDSDRGPTYLAVLVVGLTLSIVFIALRIYVRARMVKNLWWDDWFMLISLVSVLKAQRMEAIC
jgi:nicotinamide riboside transporter PnuC